VSEESHQRSQRWLELAVAAHVSIFLVGASWAFGGNADWVRPPLSVWGSLGIVLAIVSVSASGFQSRTAARTLPWALPVVGLNAMVAASCLTPGFRALAFGHETLIMPVRVNWWIPSAARGGLALRSLWLFDGIYFSCLNISLAVRRRGTLRAILAVAVGNALALSLFGIVQKVLGSTGIFFDKVATPQPQFFASFVYDNHWGAFTILMISACIGLTLRYANGSHGEGFFRGPAFTGLVVAALMGVTIPLSGSRACTLLLAILAGVALAQGAPRISRALRRSGVPPAGAFLGMLVFAMVAIASAWMVAGDVIQARALKTRDQVAAIWARGGLGSRSALYSDTLRMARDRPLFGWGMGSYPIVFGVYNTQESKIDHLPVVYHDAHSDWLQSLAELGLVGTALIGVAVAMPVMAVRRVKITPIPYFLLTGCVLVAAYAWVEFPFGNVAVVLGWWICFSSAVHYMLLTETRGGATRKP
jgi:O-antigen ligase